MICPYNVEMSKLPTLAGTLVALIMLAAACGGSSDSSAEPTSPDTDAAAAAGDAEATAETTADFSKVSPAEAADLIADPPADLVVLDVRTPEEFAAGHVEGATLVDFYDPDFADQLVALDASVPYVVYCQSGNRSGQSIEVMRDLGFVDVTDIDGGISAWTDAGLPVVK